MEGRRGRDVHEACGWRICFFGLVLLVVMMAVSVWSREHRWQTAGGGLPAMLYTYPRSDARRPGDHAKT